MKARLLVALVAGLMVGAADPAPDLGEVQSQEIPPGSKWEAEDGSVWEFGKDGKVRMKTEKDPQCPWVFVFSYTLNPMANPPRCDLRSIDIRCIYQLEGDRLLFCLARHARPTSFVHRPGAWQWLYVLKRLK